MSEEQPPARAPLPRLAAYAENFYHCSSCNYCVAMTWDEWGIDGVCPTLRHHAPALGYSGKGYIAAARAWYEGSPPDLKSLAERAFTCTTCGNCEEVCPIGMRPEHIAVALRSELLARGLAPDWAVQALADFQSSRVPGPAVMRAGEAPCEIAILYSARAPHSMAEASAAAALLGACGTVRLVETRLHDLAALNALGSATEISEPLSTLSRELAGLGAARIAVVDADGLSLLSPASGDLGIESVLSLLRAALRGGQLTLAPRADNPPPAAVGYLDPCHLTKKAHGLASLGLAGQARDLLRTLGIGVVGASAGAARFQMCCGAAGGMPASKPGAAHEMARARLAEFERQGAQTVVTASPLCAGHLAACGEAGLSVQSLCVFLMRHFEARGGSVHS